MHDGSVVTCGGRGPTNESEASDEHEAWWQALSEDALRGLRFEAGGLAHKRNPCERHRLSLCLGTHFETTNDFLAKLLIDVSLTVSTRACELHGSEGRGLHLRPIEREHGCEPLLRDTA